MDDQFYGGILDWIPFAPLHALITYLIRRGFRSWLASEGLSRFYTREFRRPEPPCYCWRRVVAFLRELRGVLNDAHPDRPPEYAAVSPTRGASVLHWLWSLSTGDHTEPLFQCSGPELVV